MKRDTAQEQEEIFRTHKLEGNTEASALIERHQHFLRRHCRLLMNGNKDDADDLFSLIVVKVLLEDPEKLRKIAHPGGWLAMIAQNQCTDLYRQRQSDNRKKQCFADLIPVLNCPPVSPEESLLTAELLAHIDRALAGLPPLLRKVAELRFIDEVSYESIAATLGITQANARKRVQKARKELATTLSTYFTCERSLFLRAPPNCHP